MTFSLWRLLLCVLMGYFIGCISPSYIIGRRKGYDVRTTGSRNAGASNTVIMAGPAAGLFVALFDIFKATAACKLGALIMPELEYAWQIAGVSCVVGHIFPVFLGFRGGKGFACLGGIVVAYSARVFLLMLAIALVIGFVSNYVAVSTVSMSVIWPLYYGTVTGNWAGAAILAIPFVPIFIRHTENFRRISRGEELRLSYLWKKDTELERINRDD